MDIEGVRMVTGLELDSEGRPCGVTGPLDFRFRAYDDFVSLTKRQRAAVREACKTASQGKSSARYIHWLGAEQMGWFGELRTQRTSF
ncbi:hypothetical protein T492DRAFT_856832 [Pavlovales sp. CCMP2436]|nr:hypothetical protein T492DRAFT_856832 [Pavlovales sp. CCMP2436]